MGLQLKNFPDLMGLEEFQWSTCMIASGFQGLKMWAHCFTVFNIHSSF